jgi:hypothetical protein
MSSVVIEKPAALPDAMTSIETPAKGWIRRSASGAIALIVGWLKQTLRLLRLTDRRTPAKIRIAEKERQKEIRRELRGLPPTPERDEREKPAPR